MGSQSVSLQLLIRYGSGRLLICRAVFLLTSGGSRTILTGLPFHIPQMALPIFFELRNSLFPAQAENLFDSDVSAGHFS